MSGYKQRKLGETAKHKFEAIYNTLSSMNLQNCPSAAKFFLELTDMLRYGTSDGKPWVEPERPAKPFDLPPPPPTRIDDRIDALARRIEAVESWINAAEPC